MVGAPAREMVGAGKLPGLLFFGFLDGYTLDHDCINGYITVHSPLACFHPCNFVNNLHTRGHPAKNGVPCLVLTAIEKAVINEIDKKLAGGAIGGHWFLPWLWCHGC